MLAGLSIGFLTYIGLLNIGAGFPLVLALVSGLLELVPVSGSVLAIGVVLVVTLLETPDKMLMVAIFVIVLQLLANQILVPNSMNSQTNVSPLLGLLAVFAGGVVGGFTGALVAIPLAAAVMVLVREVTAPLIQHKTTSAAGQAEPERSIHKIRE